MSFHRWLGTTAVVALMGALSVTAAHAQDSTSGKMGKMMKGGYMAKLASPSGGAVTGMAWVHGTKVSVKIMGDSSGAVRPWHVHSGTCDNSGPVYGSAKVYKAMTIDSDGKGHASAVMTMALPDTGSYIVNVHASSSDMKTIVACGALTKGGM